MTIDVGEVRSLIKELEIATGPNYALEHAALDALWDVVGDGLKADGVAMLEPLKSIDDTKDIFPEGWELETMFFDGGFILGVAVSSKWEDKYGRPLRVKAECATEAMTRTTLAVKAVLEDFLRK